MSKANEAASFLASVNVPDMIETHYKKCVDYAIMMTTCELWDCWEDVKQAKTLQARDEEDTSSVVSYRDNDEDSYRTSADASTVCSNLFADDEFSYLTRDDESLYSQYSRYSNYTGGGDECESLYSRSTRRSDKDDPSKKKDDEEDANFKRVMAALKKHAESLGISEAELLERLEAQQEELRKEKEEVGDQSLETVMETTEEEVASEESDQVAEQEKEVPEDGKEEQNSESNIRQDLDRRNWTALARHFGMRPSRRFRTTRQTNKQKRAQRSALQLVKVVE